LLFLAHAVLMAIVLASAAPVLRLSGAGFIAAADVALAVTGTAATLGLLAERPRRAATLGLALLGIVALIRRPSPAPMTGTIFSDASSPASSIGIVLTLLT